ncbi:hypothetical protein CsSME_00015696 [Camellia sinensis var. sinensis]
MVVQAKSPLRPPCGTIGDTARVKAHTQLPANLQILSLSEVPLSPPPSLIVTKIRPNQTGPAYYVIETSEDSHNSLNSPHSLLSKYPSPSLESNHSPSPTSSPKALSLCKGLPTNLLSNVFYGLSLKRKANEEDLTSPNPTKNYQNSPRVF